MSDYPLFCGDKEGAQVWFKLCESKEIADVRFVANSNEIGQEKGKFYFTDIIKQREKILNNQPWYVANWDITRRQWVIEPLLRPGN